MKTKAEEGTLWSDMSASAQKLATKVCATLGVVLNYTCFYSNMRDFEINFEPFCALSVYVLYIK